MVATRTRISNWLGQYRRSIFAGGIAVIMLIALVIILISPIFDLPVVAKLLNGTPHIKSTSTPAPKLIIPPFTNNSAVALENRQPGTNAWQIDPNTDIQFIQGYADRASAQPGEIVHLFVSAVAPVDYRLDVYRIGWYGGLGARLLSSIKGLHAQAQGYWSRGTGLVGCGSCSIDNTIHLIDAHWQASYSLSIGAAWVSGVYLLKLTATNHAETYIPLIVRDDTSQAALLVNLPVSTWQAYSIWGDYSLYGHYIRATGALVEPDRAKKVSFNRPYDRGAGAADFLSWDIHTIRWLERANVDVTYTTDIDLYEQPGLILHHRVFIDVGHDEYWTKQQRDAIQAARDQGISLGFFGANDGYWQARLEPDQSGNIDRTLVCYKVESDLPNDPTAKPNLDPLYAINRELTTTQFRDPILNRPENELLGLMYSSIVERFDGGRSYKMFDWVVRSGRPDPLLSGTGLTPGQHISGGLVGYEYDRIFNNGRSPADLVILGDSPITSYQGLREHANTSYYRAPSGALVFDAGTIWWGWALDDFSPPAAPQSNLLRGNQKITNLTLNLLQAMLIASPPPSIAPGQTPSATATPEPTLTPSAVPTPTSTHTPTPTPHRP